MPGCGVTCDLARETQRELLSAGSKAEGPARSVQAGAAAPAPPGPPLGTSGTRSEYSDQTQPDLFHLK